MDSRPIGVFDSGLGGLTVVRQIKKILPRENIIYLGDTARVPYGTRSKKIVTKFALEDSRFLEKKNVKCIVIACNTASSLASLEVKKASKVPVFDIVSSGSDLSNFPGKVKKIGVIGTSGTINSHAYKKSLSSNKRSSKVYEIACPLFVPFIEENEVSGSLINLLVAKYLKNLRNKNLELIILGCTHYPLIKDSINKFMGKKIELVDPGVSLAKTLSLYLENNKMLNNKGNGKVNYHLTDLNDRFVKVAEKFLGEKINDIEVVDL